MKKLLLGAFLVLSLTSFGATVYLPHDTVKVISCDYSTGGGDKPITYIEVLVLSADGNYHMYTHKIFSKSGLIGLGRYNIPEHFKFIIDNDLWDRIEYKR